MKNNKIKKFTPIWFAVVLGLGGIALSSFLMSVIFNLAWLKAISPFLVYLNLFLFLFLFYFCVTKAFFFSTVLLKEFKHEIIAGFHSLLPAAMIMIAINFAKLGEPLSLWQYQNIAFIFWLLGAFFEFIFLTASIYYLIINEKMHLNFLNGGWLVPPVAALLVPVAGLEIIKFSSLGTSLLWINYFFFGAGLFVFSLIAGALFAKLFFLKKLDPKVFPSLWIILVPFSLISMSLPSFAREISSCLGVKILDPLSALGTFVNPILIGIDFWLILLLILLTYHYLKKIELPYGEGWWAFIFPTSSLAIASLGYALATGEAFFAYLGGAVYLFLLGITLVVLTRTINHFIIKK